MSLEGYLFDASAIIESIIRGVFARRALPTNIYTLDLAIYECHNAIWKLIKRELITLEGGFSLAKSLSRLFKSVQIIKADIDSMLEVLKLAIEKGLTIYDASYLYIAKERGLTLVTEDERLIKKAIELGVKSMTVSDFLATSSST
jgi:predicted nucleic acid-binding protein